MTTKTTGAELKRFYNDDSFWPGNNDANYTWHEDEEVMLADGGIVDDINELSDEAKVTVAGGMVFNNSWPAESEPSFESYFKRWRKTQNIVSFVVDAPKDKLDAVKAAIKAAGGKVST